MTEASTRQVTLFVGQVIFSPQLEELFPWEFPCDKHYHFSSMIFGITESVPPWTAPVIGSSLSLFPRASTSVFYSLRFLLRLLFGSTLFARLSHCCPGSVDREASLLSEVEGGTGTGTGRRDSPEMPWGWVACWDNLPHFSCHLLGGVPSCWAGFSAISLRSL